MPREPHSLDQYTLLMIEMCKNEIDQGRCKFMQQDYASKGKVYNEPYQALLAKLKVS